MADITTLQSTDLQDYQVLNENFDNLNTDKAEISGQVFMGDVSFSGTGHAGLKVNSLTTTQRDALTATNGMVIYNSTTGTVQTYQGGSWIDSGSEVTGAIKSWPTTTIPTGYLLCNGQNVSRNTYSSLFGVLNTNYGSGDGSTTFGLPFFYPKEDIFQYSAKFTSSGYLYHGSTTSLSITGDISVSAWIYPTTLTSSTNYHIVAKRSNTNGQHSYRFLYNPSTGFTAHLSQSGTGETGLTVNNTSLQVNNWYHVVFSYVTSTGIMTVYVNGKSVGTASGGPSSIHANSLTFTVGTSAADGSGYTDYFEGYMFNLKLYAKAMSASDVLFDMYYPNGTGIAGSWSLNNVLTDSSGNSNDLVASGTTFENKLSPNLLVTKIIKT